MADIRINGRRFPILQAIVDLGVLVQRLDAIATRENMGLTNLSVNGEPVDLDNPGIQKLRLDPTDTVEARMETAEQLALQSLQIAQEMAELLVFDIKVATLNLWDNTRYQQRSLETLLQDCELFLTLGARPVELLGKDPNQVEKPVEECLRQLDTVANHVQDAILLAVHGKNRDASHVLVARVMPTIEKWLGHSAAFASFLELEKLVGSQERRIPVEHPDAKIIPLTTAAGAAAIQNPR